MIEETLRQATEADLSRGDIAAAAARAQAALAQGAEDPMLYNLAAWAREEVRDWDGARALLEKALALAPDDVTIVTAIGGLFRKQGRLAEALATLDRAVAMRPDYAVAWLERGYAFDVAASMKPAAANFARAAALDPSCAPAFAGHASVAARTGAFGEARTLAERALAIDPRDPVALRVAAAATLSEGDPERAVAALHDLVRRDDLPPLERFNAFSLMGDAYDKAGEPAAAFAAWNDAKAVFRALYAPHFEDGRETHRQLVERLLAELAAVDPAVWRSEVAGPVDGEARMHAVLCGYPRSGTTLAENVLASAPGVAALEELPTTQDTDDTYLQHPGGLARLATIDAAEAQRLRAAYWSRVRGFGADTRGAFVDMDPLKSIKLMVFARLFPQAVTFLMLRDPRDVVLSCFRRNFQANPATYEYITLERAAAHYDATMRLLTRSIELLPLNVHRVRYADLVSDFDATTRTMCDALGVPWSPALRDFGKTAQTRGVTTASVAQVGRGLYDGGGQWRKYEAELAPVLPVLEPWVERLGLE